LGGYVATFFFSRPGKLEVKGRILGDNRISSRKHNNFGNRKSNLFVDIGSNRKENDKHPPPRRVPQTMATALRTTRSLSLEKSVLKEVERTKGDSSTSERVNDLLKTALEVERKQCLHVEAAAFFQADEITDDREERRAFQEASFKSIGRD
jgi:hypothetical protein